MNINIGFIGFGLIAGSIAKSIRKYKPAYRIYALNRFSPDIDNSLATALNDQVIHGVYNSLESFRDCDLIFLCAPVLLNSTYLKPLKKIIKSDCIITDVGSVKGTIHGNIIENGLEKQFIGGHPMTGSNRSGYENSSETLMENAYYLLTPTSSTPECATTFMKTLIRDIGSIPYVLDYHSHDDITAAISHLPHILAASLVNIVHDHDDTESHMRTFAAGGFKDITRIASSSPEMWESICLSNPECITKYLRLFRESLDCVESFIHQKNSVALFQLFETAKNYRDSLSNNSTGTLPKVHEIYVDVPDAPGIIAIIATILSSNSVNIKNIGIVHNREFENGVLRIEFDNEDNLESALNALEKYPYTVYNR